MYASNNTGQTLPREPGLNNTGPRFPLDGLACETTITCYLPELPLVDGDSSMLLQVPLVDGDSSRLLLQPASSALRRMWIACLAFCTSSALNYLVLLEQYLGEKSTYIISVIKQLLFSTNSEISSLVVFGFFTISSIFWRTAVFWM